MRILGGGAHAPHTPSKSATEYIALEECYAPCLDKHLGRTRKVAYN